MWLLHHAGPVGAWFPRLTGVHRAGFAAQAGPADAPSTVLQHSMQGSRVLLRMVQLDNASIGLCVCRIM
jgi:hypothetical protein